MLKFIDGFLNKITMYRLVLYEQAALLVLAVGYASFHLLPYQPFAIIFSALFITLVCWIAELICSRIFKSAVNVESAYITALILALIISPPHSPFDTAYFSLAIWAGIWAMASKYIFAVKNKHIFNPAAFAVALTSLTINQSASWWVATPVLFPAVLVGGWLIIRKIRRADLVWGFALAAGVSIMAYGILRGLNLPQYAMKTLAETPLVFFATVMLTEPLTTPPTRWLRYAYGAIVGLLYSPWLHIGSLYSTPELALVAGNLFSYAVSPKEKLILTLKSKVEEAKGVTDFIFTADRPMNFRPGQYLEWTLDHEKPDAHGNRRYFTIASSPTENEIHLGVKFYEPSSSFKKALSAMAPGETITAAQLAGDFTLPKRSDEKLAFIAGGIGVTPFRSMVKHLIDADDRRSVIMLYANKTPNDIAYSNLFEEARKKIQAKIVYVITDPASPAPGRYGRAGAINGQTIREEIPDYKERKFYLSGPHGMVVAYDKVLRQMGVPASRIKKDYFPGFA
jgi:ferredoxin-NADP reductase/Na+-translocating ferredoxin:NAD+ oxidoreductase RnfD subunit